MRVSVLKGDPGYVNFRLGMRVICNGEDVTSVCQTADEEAGQVSVLLKNEDGNFYVVGNEVAHEERTGNVQILREKA